LNEILSKKRLLTVLATPKISFDTPKILVLARQCFVLKVRFSVNFVRTYFLYLISELRKVELTITELAFYVDFHVIDSKILIKN